MGNSPKYLTWDKVRLGWVFQIRVPDYVHAVAGGTTTKRIRLFVPDEASAAAAAQQLADRYKTYFNQYKPTTKKHGTKVNKVTDEEFIIDEDICKRFFATWKTQQLDLLKIRFIELRDAPQNEWDEWALDITNSITEAREHVRRHETNEFQTALGSIKSSLHIKLLGSQDNFDNLIQHFNSARVEFLCECLAAVRIEKPVSALYPDPTAQLPLIDLWGDPATQLPITWKSRVRSTTSPVIPKTLDKYTRISRDLQSVMRRRPVQMITHADLCALTTLWSTRNNKSNTIKDKLYILRSMLPTFIPDKEKLSSLFDAMKTHVNDPRAARKPLSKNNLEIIRDKFLNDPSVRVDDQMLFYIMSFLALRREEAYQLCAEDFEPDSDHWIVRFADHRQTGSGDAQIKDQSSTRDLPLRRRTIPEFDAWLIERLASGGRLFADGSNNIHKKRSEAAGQRINRRLRRLFPHDKRIVLQSTRAQASGIMCEAGIESKYRWRTLGHTCHSNHFKHYENEEFIRGEALKPATDAIADYISVILNPAPAQRPAIFDRLRHAVTRFRSLFTPQ